MSTCNELFVNPGWHNLSNEVTGEIGFEFNLKCKSGTKLVTHLGLWDDHETDRAVRPARAVSTVDESDQPSRFLTQRNRRGLKAPHVLRLDSSQRTEIAGVEVAVGEIGELHQAFRYFLLKKAVTLDQNTNYLLLMSTSVADGDQYHDPVSFDGLSPLVHPDVQIRRSLLIRPHAKDYETSIPAFEDLNDSFSRYRALVGPTLRFGS
ncbi:MAG: hypothetical protein ISQ06_03255 [Planctomycetaceae bacterium]|nr:hypothetical protein [Planctomycetaceae bacterium]